MRYTLPKNHWLNIPASQRTLTPPVNLFWRATHPAEIRQLWEAFCGSVVGEKPIYKDGKQVGTKPIRNERILISRIWARDVFGVMASILHISESKCIHAFKSDRYPIEDHHAVEEAWSKAIMVMKKQFDPGKALLDYYAGRRSTFSSEPLSVQLQRNYITAHEQSLIASQKRVDAATNPEA